MSNTYMEGGQFRHRAPSRASGLRWHRWPKLKKKLALNRHDRCSLIMLKQYALFQSTHYDWNEPCARIFFPASRCLCWFMVFVPSLRIYVSNLATSHCKKLWLLRFEHSFKAMCSHANTSIWRGVSYMRNCVLLIFTHVHAPWCKSFNDSFEHADKSS